MLVDQPLTPPVLQITNPSGQYEIFEKSVSNGDHSFDAKHDGKYIYCFGNENWGASSKEVSFNVHGIVYVSESDAPADPLEAEGMCYKTPSILPCCGKNYKLTNTPAPECSQEALRAPRPGQGRAVVHRRPRAHPPQHRREHQQPRQVVEHLHPWRRRRRVRLPGLVAAEVLRGQEGCVEPAREAVVGKENGRPLFFFFFA